MDIHGEQHRGNDSPPNDDAGEVDEAELVVRAQQGDSTAFEQLYHDHLGHLFALCVRMTGDRDLAEDLTQASFVRIWQQLKKFEQKSSFGTWSHRVAVNVVLEHLRSRARRPASATTSEEPVLRIAPTTSPGKRMDLEWAIGALPERARLVFVLYEIEGFQHVEIAEQLGIAVGTSKAQLHRARQLLRESLK